MSNYRRNFQKGGTYFFTTVTNQRQKILIKNIEILRSAFQKVMTKHPFAIDGIVILPDHIHCIFRLPENDFDYSTRWRLIKYHFSKNLPSITNTRKEKKIWQRRFWEHTICDSEDWKNHMDYIHYNPVRHGYVLNPADWEYSSFSRLVIEGLYKCNWGSVEPENILEMQFE